MARPIYKLFGPETPEEVTESESYKISFIKQTVKV